MSETPKEMVQPQFLNHVWVIHRTKNKSHAGTNSKFLLCFERDDGASCYFKFREYEYNERSPGRTDMYGFNLTGEGIREDSWIRMEMAPDSEEDATWLPDRVFVIGRLASGLLGQCKLLALHTPWNKENVFTKYVGYLLKDPGLALGNGVEAALMVGADDV